MKKTCTLLVLACSIANAQITITKDTSFGNNGTVSGLGSPSPNDWLLLIPRIHSTFQGSKIFVSYHADNSSFTQFTRLNADGSPDAAFGTNGTVVIPVFEAYYFYANHDFFYTNGNRKYLSNGQEDTNFSNTTMQMTDWNYKIVLPDGKIFFRGDNAFSKFLPDGNPDASYGTNGSMSADPSVAGDPNGSINYEFFFNKDQAVYEFISPSVGLSNIRKVSIGTGSLDTSYGQSGYAHVKNAVLPTTASYAVSVRTSANDGSFINKFTDSGNIYFTKTDGQGMLDQTVGASGVIAAEKSFLYNGTAYSAQDTEPLVYNDVILVPAENSSQDLGIACYSLNGNNLTVNNGTFYPLSDTSYTTLRFTFVKDNYLYVMHDNNISRYIIQKPVLSVKEQVDQKDIIRFENPFKEQLTLLSAADIREVEILDESGKTVLRGKGPKLNTSSLLKGSYLIRITSVSGKVTVRKGIKN
ncbi:T9SS type A sorting domain-containing protein [uncultured Chryseobacterium sp.]|uniref:T9SS type A sorting domain-containing protein n=1 Tax=uncultured Chryseobacterium sp. TaxID=259322 RepID=UPI0025E8B93A|nr:T9SS type A sorting domain-containing protein [uncultured Chryseobacterium sp.]